MTKETATIEELAYYIKQANKEHLPKPIFLLGAGASISGDIPGVKRICEDILSKYSVNPKISKVTEEQKSDYKLLMSLLTPYERNTLLNEYIKKGKINSTHINIAHLINEGYIDYVLTTNFDNLL